MQAREAAFQIDELVLHIMQEGEDVIDVTRLSSLVQYIRSWASMNRTTYVIILKNASLWDELTRRVAATLYMPMGDFSLSRMPLVTLFRLATLDFYRHRFRHLIPGSLDNNKIDRKFIEIGKRLVRIFAPNNRPLRKITAKIFGLFGEEMKHAWLKSVHNWTDLWQLNSERQRPIDDPVELIFVTAIHATSMTTREELDATPHSEFLYGLYMDILDEFGVDLSTKEGDEEQGLSEADYAARAKRHAASAGHIQSFIALYEAYISKECTYMVRSIDKEMRHMLKIDLKKDIMQIQRDDDQDDDHDEDEDSASAESASEDSASAESASEDSTSAESASEDSASAESASEDSVEEGEIARVRNIVPLDELPFSYRLFWYMVYSLASKKLRKRDFKDPEQRMFHAPCAVCDSPTELFERAILVPLCSADCQVAYHHPQ